MRRRRALTAALLLLLAGTWWCRWDETRGLNTREEMVATLLRFVPPGTPVDRAQQYMESRGFRCSRLVNEDWLQWPEEGGAARVTRQGIDYVYCYRVETRWLLMGIHENLDPIGIPWPVTRRWDVGLVHSGSMVTEILVNTGVTL